MAGEMVSDIFMAVRSFDEMGSDCKNALGVTLKGLGYKRMQCISQNAMHRRQYKQSMLGNVTL
jgi:hypothetical protein